MTFATWLDDTATDRIILADMQMGEQTAGDGWSVYSGSAYRILWSSFIATDVVQGGVFRRIDGVKQNDIDLTEVGSAASVVSTPSSWFYDSSTTYLYVRTSTGSDPDLFSSIMVLFSLFFGTTSKNFAGGQAYEPMLVGELPVIRLQADNILFGVKLMEEGTVEFQNAHGFWDKVSQLYIWKNKKITFYMGGGDLDFVDYEKLAVMRIEDAAVGDETARFTLTHLGTVLDKILLPNTFTTSDNPNLGPGVEGTYQPVLWGSKKSIPCRCIDTTIEANVWQVSDPSVHQITAITNVRAVDFNGIEYGLSETTQYTPSLINCNIEVYDPDFAYDNYSIVCDAVGKTDGGSSYLKKWAELSQDILELHGEATADFDSSSFTTADSDNSAELALLADEPKTVGEYLADIQRSVRGYILINEAGQWEANVWLPYGLKGETADSRADEDFVSWQPEEKLETTYHKVVVKYDKNHWNGDWRERSTENSQSQYEMEKSDVARINTLLVNGSSAKRHSERLLLTLKGPSTQITIQERGLASLLMTPFQRLLISRSRAPHVDGEWVDEQCELLEIQKVLAPPAVGIRIRSIDLDGRGDRIRFWASSGIPDYDPASGAQKEAYAFWHDSNGEVGAGNVEKHSAWY